MKGSLAKASEEYLKLLGYVVDQEHGAELDYEKVERETGVKMTRKGRDKLRRAILRSKREYEVIPNVGYKLAQADSTIRILVNKLESINSRVKAADRAQQTLVGSFYEELPDGEKKQVLFVASVFGAIRVASERGKRLYSEKKPQQITQGGDKDIPIPP